MTEWGVVALCATAAMLAAWWVQQRTQNAGIVDVIWAFGMAFAGGFYAFTGSGPEWMRLMLGLLSVVWFARLGLHLQRRLVEDPSEDGRYAAMRRWFGDRSGVGFFLFFQAQAGFIVLFSLPFLMVASTPEPEPILVAAGVAVALAAFLGEAAADRQLREFRNDPANKGRVCRLGWWRLSRHPNYFFEWLHWFAYPLMGAGGPYGYLLWLAPLIMLIFLVFLTGIPFSEQQAMRSRGDEYRVYRKQTSAFFPWRPSTRT